VRRVIPLCVIATSLSVVCLRILPAFLYDYTEDLGGERVGLRPCARASYRCVYADWRLRATRQMQVHLLNDSIIVENNGIIVLRM
jgi:hypothetical protein